MWSLMKTETQTKGHPAACFFFFCSVQHQSICQSKSYLSEKTIVKISLFLKRWVIRTVERLKILRFISDPKNIVSMTPALQKWSGDILKIWKLLGSKAKRLPLTYIFPVKSPMLISSSLDSQSRPWTSDPLTSIFQLLVS